MERTLVLIKPDAFKRCLVGEIISRFERKGLRIAALEMRQVTRELSRKHYAEHLEKEFYPRLEKFILSGPVVAMIIEGAKAVEVVRLMMGATDFTRALPGTIRGDLALHATENLVHGSDSLASADREIKLWFGDEG